MQPNQAVIDEWSEAAPFWEKHRTLIGHMFAPVTDALAAAAGIRKGHRVLDVATGPGDPAFRLVSLVGSEGWVDGTDPVPAMVSAARREASRLAVRNIRFEIASGDQLPFPSATFDATVSRFGVMFFPEPVAGIREMLRVVKSGGKVALAVWHHLKFNPFFSVVERVLAEYVAMAPSEPDSPNSFRFATPGKLREVLLEAGVRAPVETVLRFQMMVPVSLADFWTLRCDMSDKLRGHLATLTTEQVHDVRRRTLEEVLAWKTDTEFRFPTEVLILSGTKDTGGDPLG